MEPRILNVPGAGGGYPVIIGEGLLGGELVRRVRERGARSACVVTNATVAPLYGEPLAAALPGGFLAVLPDGEEHKGIESVRAVWDVLVAGGADRGTLIVALGGGVVGDTAGFAAATFMRGLPLIHAPTTLLAMLDSSIGGKTGVNLPAGKNLVGAFKDPEAVIADLSTLGTLPEVERRCGLAEAIKSALVGDAVLFGRLLSGEAIPAAGLVVAAAAVKVRLVGEDRLEHGSRAFLNLGHTFGHAIEALSGFSARHGEAVAVGLVAAARLSARLGLCPPRLPIDVERAVAGAGLPVGTGNLASGAILDAMGTDKKCRGGELPFVLLEDAGKPVLVRGVPRSDLAAVLDGMGERGA
ncbi:MAG: 3-dehydroquinate synthase [Spirochaetes bacterium]|nr:3-dehydroquinate synthase [Spirochaetota bacterium]